LQEKFGAVFFGPPCIVAPVFARPTSAIWCEGNTPEFGLIGNCSFFFYFTLVKSRRYTSIAPMKRRIHVGLV